MTNKRLGYVILVRSEGDSGYKLQCLERLSDHDKPSVSLTWLLNQTDLMLTAAVCILWTCIDLIFWLPSKSTRLVFRCARPYWRSFIKNLFVTFEQSSLQPTWLHAVTFFLRKGKAVTTIRCTCRVHRSVLGSPKCTRMAWRIFCTSTEWTFILRRMNIPTSACGPSTICRSHSPWTLVHITLLDPCWPVYSSGNNDNHKRPELSNLLWLGCHPADTVDSQFMP